MEAHETQSSRLTFLYLTPRLFLLPLETLEFFFLAGHDRSGKEVWVQPPPPEAMMRGYGYSPYDSGFGPGSYRAPMNPYGGRGRGMGYGGGMGMPIGLGLGGGLLLGAALF